MSSLKKLDTMYAAFVDNDNGKLSRGEVDALAGFYKGLAPRSQATVRDRMIEIYRDSSFSKGQKDWFRNMLEGAGFSVEQLEGIKERGAEGFAKLPLAEQFDRITGLGGWGDGHDHEIDRDQIPRGARTQIAKAIAAFERDYKAERAGDGIDYDFHAEGATRAIYLEEGPDGRGKDLVGYSVELGIYTGDHDVDEMLYFNRKGQYLGNEYHGE